jgi:AbiV family abortive infection protein
MRPTFIVLLGLFISFKSCMQQFQIRFVILDFFQFPCHNCSRKIRVVRIFPRIGNFLIWNKFADSAGAGEKLHMMEKTDMLKGMELVLKNVKKLLHNSELLLNSTYQESAFVLYSYAYEEFGKALFIKDYIENENGGLPEWLFKQHGKKMDRARQFLPEECSYFTPTVRVSQDDKIETIQYKVWRKKFCQVGTVTPGGMTGDFADTTSVRSQFDHITREELLLVNYDPTTNEWHLNPVYRIDELKLAVRLLKERLTEFATIHLENPL